MDQATAITRIRAEKLLARGRSVILDFDAINPQRHKEFHDMARQFGARLYLLEVKTPERLILARLRKKRYTSGDLFENAAEAVRVYFARRKFRKKFPRFTLSFTIDNSRSLEPQITRMVNAITGL